MTPRDRARLLDMLDHAKDAVVFLGDADASSLQEDRKTRGAVLNAVVTLGEASAALSDAIKSAHANIDWRGMKSMRNILIHNYRSVDASILVAVVRDDLPVLIAQLEALLAEDPS